MKKGSIKWAWPLFVFTLLMAYPFGTLHSNQCYSEYWQKLLWTAYEKDAVEISTYVKLESRNHWKGFRYIQLSEQLAYHLTKTFSMEIHYTYIHSHDVVADTPWRWRHRLELEGNRIFYLPQNQNIQTRNRLEIYKEQFDPTMIFRLRQLTLWEIPINGRVLKSFSMYNEIFYNLTTHRFTQDRICPCQFTFALTEEMEMDLFFLLRLFEFNSVWLKTGVFGTQISF